MSSPTDTPTPNTDDMSVTFFPESEVENPSVPPLSFRFEPGELSAIARMVMGDAYSEDLTAERQLDNFFVDILGAICFSDLSSVSGGKMAIATIPPASTAIRSPSMAIRLANLIDFASIDGATIHSDTTYATIRKAVEKEKAPNEAVGTEGFVVPKSPGPLRAMLRARGMAPFKVTSSSSKELSIEPSMTTDDWGQEDGSSSEEELSEDEDEISIDDESSLFDDVADDAELVSDFSSIVPMPNTFLDLPPDLYDYLDPELVKNIASQKISIYAYEHHLLVKGLLQLLAERDVVGVEGDIHDSSNVIKMGPLKKKSSHGLWLVKYVEIRRGNLSYFSDNASQFGSAPRKTIHLRKRTCRCEPVMEPNSVDDSFVFQLLVEGGPKKIWLANSDEERQGWIRAINQAMIGETEGSQDAPVDLSIYESAIQAYLSVQRSLKQVESREDYLVAVDGLLYRKSSSSALRVPMTWVREEIIQRDDKRNDAHTPNALVKTSISENWKCLSNTTVDINGCLILADTIYSPDRVIGTLSRCILEFDRVDHDERESGILTKTVKRCGVDSFMTEVEAVSYARTILFGALRSEIQGDVMAAVKNLVQNEKIALVELETSEPLHIDVSFAGDDFSEREKEQSYDMSGWLNTRSKKGKVWKRRFFVLSEGILSFFAQAVPRPFDLRGQMVLSKCVIKSVDDENVLLIERNEEERCLQFEDRGALLKWRVVLERAADSEFPVVIRVPEGPPESPRRLRGTIAVKPLQTARRGAMKAMKGAKNAGMKKIKNARGIIARSIASRQREKDRWASTHDMLMMSTRGLLKVETQKREPSVQAVTEFNHVFKVMPIQSGDDTEPLLTIRVKLYQAFLLSGGANGLLSRGDELIEMEFLGLEDDRDHEFLEAPTLL